MTRSIKRTLLTGAFFCAMAVLFAVLYYLHIIKNLSLILAVVYVAYFVGLALIYNGVYCKKQVKTVSSTICFIAGGIFVVAAVGLMIYGFCEGMIVF